jgi:4-carboxymuconolactone decarboxylase
LPEALAEMTMNHVFGEVWSRPGLALRDRSLATVTMLAALGRDPYLRIHLHGALNLGISEEELEELFLHLAHYAGWPLGIAASRALADVVAEREAAGAEA